MFLVMGKIKQRNWLIIITVFLVIVSGIGLFVSIHKNLSFNSCAYGENGYRSGESVPEYNGRTQCICNSDGKVICSDDNEIVEYNRYSSQNLKFSYKYINMLSKDILMSEDVTSTGVSYFDGIVKVDLERNALCTEDGIIPAQSGLYQLSNQSLKLTIMTGIDNSKYIRPCRIADSFEISGVDITLDNNFQIYYQSSDGQTFSLGACIQNGALYGDQEVFKSQDLTSICTCNTGSVTCKQL